MKSLFPSHFPKSEAQREALWDECVFVFDTNVLTSLYKRSDDARSALLEIIRSLGARVWIPYQVIYEFLNNRPMIAHQQSCMYQEAKEKLEAFLADLDSTTKHPFLGEELHREFVNVASKVSAELESKAISYGNMIVFDDVKEQLSQLLEGKVGGEYDKPKLDGIVKEGEVRYSNHIPPGYEDSGKHKGSSIFEHVRARYGDLILWKQILDHARQNSLSVVLVTGDQKDDWWLRAGGKTIGPRPELLDEFRKEVGKDFYMYSHSVFLRLANEYLNQQTSSTVIQEIQDAANELSSFDSDGTELALEEPDSDFIPNEERFLMGRIAILHRKMQRVEKALDRIAFELVGAKARNDADELRSLREERLELSELRNSLAVQLANFNMELSKLALVKSRRGGIDPLV